MANKNNRKPSNRAAAPKAESAADRKPRSAARGVLSIGAVVGVLAAGVFGLLKLGRERYTDGQPLASGPQPKPVGSASTSPVDAVDGEVSDGSFGSGEHVPTDLMGDKHPGLDDRAVDAFRPDPTAAIPEGERDAFRPALVTEAPQAPVKKKRPDIAPS